MKRIAVILPSLRFGGAEVMAAQLMAGIDKTKYKILLIVLENEEKEGIYPIIKNNGIEYVCCNKVKKYDLKALKRVSGELLAFKPDVIHSHMFAYLYAVPYALKHKIKLVHTIHSMPTFEMKSIYRMIIKRLYKSGKAIPVAISKTMGREVKRYYGVEPQVVNNPVLTDRFYHKERSDSKVRFINVGRLTAPKNQALLLRAYKKVSEKNPDTELYIVGGGEEEESLLKLRDELGINVTFTGAVSNVCDYLAEADVFVLSSDIEGLPLAVLEAMASSLPVVTTDAGGVADIVTDNGVIVPKNDEELLFKAMLDMAENKEKRLLMAKNSKKNVSEFDITKCVEKYCAIYEKVTL